MTRRKKIFSIIIIVVGLLLVVLLAFQIILPKLINLESIKGKILAISSEKVGGEVKFGNVALSLFPYPHAVIDDVSLSIPGKVRGSLHALGVYSKLLPLLKGKLQIAEAHFESPEFNIVLPRKTTKEPGKELSAPSLDIPSLTAQILAPLIMEAPNLEVEIKNGKLDLSRENESLFSFKSINAHIVLPPKGFKLQLSCASNLWGKMEVMSTLDATDYKGDIRIDVKDFQPHRLTSYLFAGSPLKLADSSMNMSVDLNVNGLNNVQANVQGSIPLLSFHQRNGDTVLKGNGLKSTLRLNENEIKFSLEELNLNDPKVSLSGSFLWGRRAPRVSLEIEGKDIDVPSARNVALGLAGDVPDVQDIFGVVKGGNVPLITLKSEGSTYDQLGDIKNILIKGHIVEGKILVPDVELDLADVKGEAVISKGVLYGENLEARVGNSWGRAGNLKLGLGEDDDTFHLDIGVQADLAELPPIMKRLLEDKSFQAEMRLIEGLKGEAEGRLVLGETTKAVNARVDVSKLSLSAKYRRIPYPIRINGGHFFYDETRIGVKNFTGKLGKSSFSQLSANVSLNRAPYLEVKSGIFDVFLEEIYAWLVSIEGSPIRPEDIKTLQGDVHIGSLSLKGPLLKPGKWHTKTSWETRNALVGLSLLPAPVKVSKGKFEGRADSKNQELSFKDVEVGLLDARMTVSGAVNDYYKGINNINLDLDGVMGSESYGWITSLLKTPPQLVLRTPLSISKGQLHWKKDAQTSFKADLDVPGGASISTDIFYSSEEMRAENLIRDEVSQASSAFRLKGRELGLQFNGHLKRETLNNLFVRSGFFHGWLEGDLRAHISLDHPMESTAQGHLMGENLIFPHELGVPLEIDKISLKAEERHVEVEQATLVSGSHKIDLEGSLDFSPPGLVFNMEVKSNGIHWTDIEGLLGEGGKENDLEQGKASWDLPLQGTVKLESEYFNYERFTWFPFNADITIAQNEIDLKVIQANLCHVSTPGSLKITPKDVSLDFDFTAAKQDLNPSVLCTSGQQLDITGNFDLLGKIKAQGKEDTLLKSLKGDLEFTARDGQIRRHVPLQRVFAYLNVTESLRGQLPDLTKQEFVYDSITSKITIQDGKIIFNESIIDSPSMEIVSKGHVDYMAKKLDIMVLVAPFKTVDWVIKKIPIVRRILGGTLIAVPVSVRGDWSDPVVTPMSASAVGSSLLGVLERTGALPFELIDVKPTGEALDIPMEWPEP